MLLKVASSVSLRSVLPLAAPLGTHKTKHVQ